MIHFVEDEKSRKEFKLPHLCSINKKIRKKSKGRCIKKGAFIFTETCMCFCEN